MKKLVSIVLSFSVVFLIIGNVSAMQSQTSDKKANMPVVDFQSAVEQLEPYVIRQADNTFELQAPKNVIAKIPADIYMEITQGMQMVNTMIQEQALITTDDLHVFTDQPIIRTTSAALLSDGVDKLVIRWYGFDLYLSHSTIQLIRGAGIAGIPTISLIIVASIPGVAIYAAAFAASITLVLGVIYLVDQGRGVIMHLTPTFQLIWMSAQ